MTEGKRIQYLDSIRGLAAMSVVIFHCISNHWGYRTEAKVSFLLFNGSDAVSLFFVLSGLVLTLQLNYSCPDKIGWTEYKHFLAKRLFRIYPAYLVCLLIYYCYAFGHLPVKEFIVHTLTNRYYFLQELLLIRENHNLYLPGWSLGIEIALSALLPFFVLLYRYDKKLFGAFVAAVLILNKHYISIFSLHFCLGIVLASCYDKIFSYDFKKSIYYKYRSVFYIILFALYNFRHLLSLLPDTFWYDKISEILYLDEFIFTGIGAAGVLAFCINNHAVQSWLSVKPLVFLGKISYGIYLTHWFFLTILLDNWNYFYPIFNNEFYLMLFYIIITVSATLIVSTVLYYAVEQPLILFARKRFH